MNNVTFINLAKIIIDDFMLGGSHGDLARKAYDIGMFLSLKHDCLAKEDFFKDFLWYLAEANVSSFYFAGILHFEFDYSEILFKNFERKEN